MVEEHFLFKVHHLWGGKSKDEHTVVSERKSCAAVSACRCRGLSNDSLLEALMRFGGDVFVLADTKCLQCSSTWATQALKLPHAFFLGNVANFALIFANSVPILAISAIIRSLYLIRFLLASSTFLSAFSILQNSSGPNYRTGKLL